MFFLLSKTLDLALAPLSWAIVLVVVALAAPARRVRLRRGALVAALAVIVVFSAQPVSNRLAWRLESAAPKTVRDDVVYDAAILLTGLVADRPTEDRGVRSYGDAVERMLATFELLRSGRARFAIITGGAPAGSTTTDEARVIADQLADWGIAKDRLIVEDRALNTRENAVEASRIAREHRLERLVIVTSAFHMPRALACFRAVDLAVDALPVDYRAFDPSRHGSTWLPRAIFLADSTDALREMAGGVVYRARGFAR